MPLIGEDVDIPLFVPGDDTPLLPWQSHWITSANSTLVQLQRVLARQRSQILYVDKFVPQEGWDVVTQKLRVVGEMWAYLQLTLKKMGTKVTVPSNGNFAPIIVGAVKDPRLVPQSLAHLGSVDTGRLAAGHILNSGEVKLDAINSGADIKVGDVLTLAGPYPLDDWVDSGA